MTPSRPARRLRQSRRSRRTYFGKRENPIPSPKQRRGRLHKARQARTGSEARRRRPCRARRQNPHVPYRARDREQVRDVVVRNVSRESALHTDESNLYIRTGEEFAAHRTVKHSGGEYVRYEDAGMVTPTRSRTCSRCSIAACMASISIAARRTCTATLHEFAFRYNHRSGLGVSDTERADAALRHRRQAPHLSADW